MKIIVAGPRDFTNHQFVYGVLSQVVKPWDVIIQGGAAGVDRIAQTWARTHGIACRTFPALWEKQGRAAGGIRNEQMAREADVLIAFVNGSPGTANMIRQMQVLKKQIMYVYLDDTKGEAVLAEQYRFYGEEGVYTKSGKEL
jgi:hypothetical protein